LIAIAGTTLAVSAFAEEAGERWRVVLVRPGFVYAAWDVVDGAAAGRKAALLDSTGVPLDTVVVDWARGAISALRTATGRASSLTAAWIAPLEIPVRRPQGRLAVALDALPTTLDPALATSLAERRVVSQMFEGLVRLDANLEIEPAGAERLEDRDGRWRFHLRPDRRFHDGRPVRAIDVKIALERALSPELAAPRVQDLAAAIAGGREYLAGRTRGIGGISVIDSLTVDILPVSKNSRLLAELATPAAAITSIERAGATNFDPELARAPLGSGPFRLVRSDSAGALLVAVTGRDGGPDTLDFRLEPSASRSLLDFELGRLDVVEASAADVSERISGRSPAPTVVEEAQASTDYLGFDTRNPFLADRAHRRALAGALDRALAVKVLVPGRGRLAERLAPPVLVGPGAPGLASWLPSLAESQTLARAFAARAPELSLWLPSGSSTGIRLAEFVAAAYRRLGYRIRIVERPWPEFRRAVLDGRADLFYESRFADSPDPVAFVASLVESGRRGAGGNASFYSNPKVDAALQSARRAADTEAALTALRTAERLALEDAPLVPLFHGVSVVLVRPGVRGVQLHPLGTPRYDAVEVGDAR
jgi:ABC-type transport system substrate-binding protein